MVFVTVRSIVVVVIVGFDQFEHSVVALVVRRCCCCYCCRRRRHFLAHNEFNSSFQHFDEPMQLKAEKRQATNIAMSWNGERHLEREERTEKAKKKSLIYVISNNNKDNNKKFSVSIKENNQSRIKKFSKKQ